MSIRLELNDEIRDALRIPRKNKKAAFEKNSLYGFTKRGCFHLEKLDRLRGWKSGISFSY